MSPHRKQMEFPLETKESRLLFAQRKEEKVRDRSERPVSRQCTPVVSVLAAAAAARETYYVPKDTLFREREAETQWK
jgi:hypothetical protein